jgi:UDP:flavonoid glycosyltransferase YjiC (YdhE family)
MDDLPAQPSVLFACLPLYGHLGPLQRQAKELARRGWTVRIASTDEARPYFGENMADVEFVNIGSGGLSPAEAQAIVSRVSAEPDFLKGMMQIVNSLIDTWPTQYDGFATVIAQHRPTCMVVDFATTAALDAAEAAGVPFIVNNADLLPVLPGGLFPPANDVPPLFAGKSKQTLGRVDRFLAPVTRWVNETGARLTVGLAQNRCRRLRGLPPIDYHKRLAGKRILVNSAFGIEYERPLPPEMYLVGPMLDPNEPPLTKEENDWLTNGPPVVFVNLGTVAQPTREHVRKLAEGLTSPNFRVLWVLRPPARDYLLDTLPPTIRIESWVSSQVRVLEHPNVRAFVSHCGTNSVQESLYAGTPVVGFPMFAAQRDMGSRLTDAGVGVQLDKARFTPEALRAAVEQVLKNDAFQRATQPIRKQFDAAGGVSRAADLIEAFAARL